MKKTIAALLATAGMSFGGSASAIVVGGIDFGVIGETTHFETAEIYETIITGDGQTLLGYGRITTVNGATGTDYCGGDPDCALFFTFEYTSQNFTPTSAEFINGTINIYYEDDATGINLLSTSSAANLAYITSLEEWVQLTGHDNVSATCTAELCATGVLTGGEIAFLGDGLLDVNTDGSFGDASVASYLDGNGVPDELGGLADIRINTSGDTTQANLVPALTPCTFEPGSFCINGSADTRGLVAQVPEPGTLSLLGLALAGLGFGAGRFRRT